MALFRKNVEYKKTRFVERIYRTRMGNSEFRFAARARAPFEASEQSISLRLQALQKAATGVRARAVGRGLEAQAAMGVAGPSGGVADEIAVEEQVEDVLQVVLFHHDLNVRLEADLFRALVSQARALGRRALVESHGVSEQLGVGHARDVNVAVAQHGALGDRKLGDPLAAHLVLNAHTSLAKANQVFGELRASLARVGRVAAAARPLQNGGGPAKVVDVVDARAAQ